jgi:hypothetical protein
MFFLKLGKEKHIYNMTIKLHKIIYPPAANMPKGSKIVLKVKRYFQI